MSTDVSRAEQRGGAEVEPFLLRVSDIKKRYGHTQALDGVTLSIGRSEIVGIVGHNGAGKSTLMRVMCGLTPPDTGVVEVEGWNGEGKYDLARAQNLGVRIAFQELSLCPTLRVFENVIVAHPRLAGLGWQSRAQQAILRQVDEIFPGNRISPHARIGSLSLAQRQMVEVSQAALDSERRPMILILDEPTSALGKESADNLFRYVRRMVQGGLSCVLITHRIREVLENADRVVVMRNGSVAAMRTTSDLTEDAVIALMGSTSVATAREERKKIASGADPIVKIGVLNADRVHTLHLEARPGEIIGLAGLDGQGQRELLLELWGARHSSRRRGIRVSGRLAFVTGDRQSSGLYPLWSVLKNLSISALFRLGRFGLLNSQREQRLGRHWIDRLAVKGTLNTPIPDLSGGTQQKVLIARALAVGADVVLLDDPFRGVDVGTKREIYRLLRDEALQGRCFIWFTTENAELQECDRVYVFHEGSIAAELGGENITEDRVIAASFGGTRPDPESRTLASREG